MKYPCENCVVDPICLTKCIKLDLFFESVMNSKSRYNFLLAECVLSRKRTIRLMDCYRLSKYYDSSFIRELLKRYREVNGERLLFDNEISM